MVRRNEFQRRNNNQGSYSGPSNRNTQDQGTNRDRENAPVKNFHREGTPRQNHPNQGSPSRHINRIRAEETVDDIKTDIVRIEKEIELEIKEIKSMRLGL